MAPVLAPLCNLLKLLLLDCKLGQKVVMLSLRSIDRKCA